MTSSRPRSSIGKGIAAAVAAAVALTVLNAFKPLHIDDVVPWYFANQILEHPLSLYDFEIHWQQIPQPAQNPIAPPVLPYWWAAGIKLFGQNEVLWKLWLFPFNLALSVSAWAIFRRFARGFEQSLMWCSVLAPSLLPGLNLIIEVPCVSLGLAATALFFRACDRKSSRLAILSGIVCALAMQTKWTAFVVPGVFMLYALTHGKFKLWILAAGVASLLFVSWEGYTAFQSGESHFVHQLKISNPVKEERSLFLPLITYVGGLAPAAALIGLAGLWGGKKSVTAAALAFVIGFSLIAMGSGFSGSAIRNPFTGRPWQPRLDTPVFLAMGAFVWGVTLLVTLRIWRPFRSLTPWRRPGLAAGWFLAGWLALEVVGYFVFSPFGAARRVITVVFVITLVAGRLASLTCRSPGRAKLVRWSAAFGVMLGLGYQLVDTAEAIAGERTMNTAARWARTQSPDATCWFSGFWNSEFYGPRAGLKPLILGQSNLKPGDRIVVMDVKMLEGNRYLIDESRLSLEQTFATSDAIPFSTVPCYYIGRRPLESQAGPRVAARVYRVTAPFHPVQELDPQGKAKPKAIGVPSPSTTGKAAAGVSE